MRMRRNPFTPHLYLSGLGGKKKGGLDNYDAFENFIPGFRDSEA